MSFGTRVGREAATRFMDGGAILVPPYTNAPSSLQPQYFPDKRVNMPGNWSEEGVVCIQQSWPLPATILAIVPEMILGDDVD